MVSQLHLMWASLVQRLEKWMETMGMQNPSQDARMVRLKRHRNINSHPALPLAYLLDPMYAQTASGVSGQPGQPGQRLFGPKGLSQVSS